MKKFAVVLSGCGVFDGAEIHEATLTMLAIMKQGATYEIFAPDIPQHHVINHLTGQEMDETRNVLVESARIARGKIRNLIEFKPDEIDGLLLPGGFGAAKNLSGWAFDGADSSAVTDVSIDLSGVPTGPFGNIQGNLTVPASLAPGAFGSGQVTYTYADIPNGALDANADAA